MSKIINILLKLLVSGVLIAYLFFFSDMIDIKKVIAIFEETRLWIVMVVFLISVGNVLITTKRWSLFIPEEINYWRLVSLCFIGYFFNTFLPGRVSGDLVKTFYLHRDIDKGIPSIVSVFLDRYLGFCAMLIISVIVFTGGYSYFEGTGIALFIPLIFSVFLLANLVLWKINWGRINIIRSFYEALMGYKEKKKAIFKGLLFSIMVQLLSITEVYLLSVALGISVPIIYFFIFVPVINAISAIPVTSMGLGVREAGFVTLFNMFFARLGVTSDQAISISLMMFATMVLVNLIGGIEYLRIRERSK